MNYYLQLQRIKVYFKNGDFFYTNVYIIYKKNLMHGIRKIDMKYYEIKNYSYILILFILFNVITFIL